MNIAVLPNSPDTAPQIVDPLDHLAEKLFHRMGSDGVYARTALYEGVVEKLAALITSHREAGTEVMRFPPVMSRAQLEKSGYLRVVADIGRDDARRQLDEILGPGIRHGRDLSPIWLRPNSLGEAFSRQYVWPKCDDW